MTRRTDSGRRAPRRRVPGVSGDVLAVVVLSVAAWQLANAAGAPEGVAGYAGGLMAGLTVAALTPRWVGRAARRLGWQVRFTRERARW
jgi:hypothetical protein